MVLPIAPIVTLAACGSLLTAVKSGWDLSQMLKQKDIEKQIKKDARCAVRDLQKLCDSGVLSKDDFNLWYGRLVTALAKEDALGVKKVRSHLGILISLQGMSFSDDFREDEAQPRLDLKDLQRWDVSGRGRRGSADSTKSNDSTSSSTSLFKYPNRPTSPRPGGRRALELTSRHRSY